MVGLLIGIARLSATRLPMLGRYAARFATSRDHVSMARFAKTTRWAIVALLTALFVFHSFDGHAAHDGFVKAPANIHFAGDGSSGANESSASAERHHHLAQEDHSYSFSFAAQCFTIAPSAGRDSRWAVRHDSLLAALRYDLERPPRPLVQG